MPPFHMSLISMGMKHFDVFLENGNLQFGEFVNCDLFLTKLSKIDLQEKEINGCDEFQLEIVFNLVLIWLSGCPTRGHFRAKKAKNVYCLLFN